MSNIIVNKIGGAVLSSPNGFGALLDLVQSFNDEPNVLVISALGTSTRSLIGCAEEVLISELDSAKDKLEFFIEDYSGFGKELLNSNKNYQDKLNSTKNEISGLLKGIHLTKELSPRTLDKIMSYGELLTLELVAEYLEENNIDVIKIDSREFIITDSEFTNAKPIEELCQREIERKLSPYLNRKTIVLTQGFIGSNQNNETTTMGLESSNLTASLIANFANAKKVIYWTNVEGIRDIDPDLTSSHKLIGTMSYDFARRAALYGLKLVYPGMLDFSKNCISIEYRSAIKPNQDYTELIDNDDSSIILFILTENIDIGDDTENAILSLRDPYGRYSIGKSDCGGHSLITILLQNYEYDLEVISSAINEYRPAVEMIRMHNDLIQILVKKEKGKELAVRLYNTMAAN
jgi:aspartate kinase